VKRGFHCVEIYETHIHAVYVCGYISNDGFYFKIYSRSVWIMERVLFISTSKVRSCRVHNETTRQQHAIQRSKEFLLFKFKGPTPRKSLLHGSRSSNVTNNSVRFTPLSMVRCWFVLVTLYRAIFLVTYTQSENM
jgi:hypothetical protein